MSSPSSLRTVISARRVTNAASSLVASSPEWRIQARAVGGQEQVAAVAVQLGPLVLVYGVLDGQRMQPELVTQHRQVVAVGVAQVEPDVVTDSSAR